jgi:HNH endonuclease
MLENVIVPEGPLGGGAPAKYFKQVLNTPTCHCALTYLFCRLWQASIVPNPSTGCRVFLRPVDVALRDILSGRGEASVNIDRVYRYPTLSVSLDGESGADVLDVTVLCHRFMRWFVNGPSVGEKIYVHHVCENKRCVNPAHLEWVTPSFNTKGTEAQLKRRREMASSQERSPSGRFRKRSSSVTAESEPFLASEVSTPAGHVEVDR